MGVGAVLLAAGTSSRMGAINKLTTPWNGKPLIAHVWDAISASAVAMCIVVTGHEADHVEMAVPGAPNVHNPNFESGMASSIVCGLAALNSAFSSDHMELEGVIILLGDMPLVSAAHIDGMVAAFERSNKGEATIVVATDDGRLGNPVLFGKAHFEALKSLKGDRGARALIESHSSELIAVEIGRAAKRDFDTPKAFENDVS